jgi:hypothetical protein
MRLPILAAFTGMLLASPALSAPRAALVIGNETYMTGQPAPGAVAAAQKAAKMLEAADFEVTLGLDADIAEMTKVLEDFEDHVRDAEIALVVYIGRAVAFGGATWLVPTGADADSMAELGLGSTPLALPMGIAQQAEAAILVIDGAWPARFDGQPGLGVGAFHEGPGVAPGLADVPAARALVVSAAPPGKPGSEPGEREVGAADFALLAIAAVLGPDADLTAAEDRLRAALPGAHIAGTLAAGADLAMPTDRERAEELEFWKRAEAEASPQGYTAYLERYPDGYFAHAAQSRLEELAGGDAAFAAAAEDALALDDAQRRSIVEVLAALGFKVGDEPGVFGPETREAIRAWQMANGQAATGFLTREQARQLLSPGAR